MAVKTVDALGRIVIPKEFRKQLGIVEGNSLEVSLDGNKIIIELTNEESEDDCIPDIVSAEEFQNDVLETINAIKPHLDNVAGLLTELQEIAERDTE